MVCMCSTTAIPQPVFGQITYGSEHRQTMPETVKKKVARTGHQGTFDVPSQAKRMVAGERRGWPELDGEGHQQPVVCKATCLPW